MQTRRAAAVLISGLVVATAGILRHSFAVGLATIRPERSGLLAVLELLSLYFIAVLLPAIALKRVADQRSAVVEIDRFGQLLWSLAAATAFVDAVLSFHTPASHAPLSLWAVIVGVSAYFAVFILRGCRRADVVGLLAFGTVFLAFGATYVIV